MGVANLHALDLIQDQGAREFFQSKYRLYNYVLVSYDSFVLL